MTEIDQPAETLPASLATNYAGESQDHEQHDELQWLTVAASKVIDRAIDGEATVKQLGQFFETYRSTGESEQLIGAASGVVALVGLHHVKKGTLTAREVLEAAPQLIIDTAEEDNANSDTFAAQLADATEEFCTGTIEENSVTDDTRNSIQSQAETEPPFSRTLLNRLAVRAKQGDIHATNQLMAQSARWARTIIANRNYFIPGGEWDDMCQDTLVSVTRALKAYNPARGNFAPLAELAINRGIWTSIRMANRGKHSPLNHSKDLHSPLQGGDAEDGPMLIDVIPSPSPNDNTEIKVLDRERLREFSGVLDQLTGLERDVLLLQANGFSYTEIAQTLNVNNKSVDNAIMRSKRKFAAWEAGELTVKPECGSAPRIPRKQTALQEARETPAKEGDLFSPEESLIMAAMAHCGSLEQVGEKLEVSRSTISKITQPARERLGAESTLHLMLIAIAAGIIDISHIPEGMTSTLNEKDRDLLSAHYSPEPAIRADALKNNTNTTRSRFNRMYDKLKIDKSDPGTQRWLTVLYAVKDGIIELPDTTKLKTSST